MTTEAGEKPSRRERPPCWRSRLLLAALVLSAVSSAAVAGLAVFRDDPLDAEVERRARALVDGLALARAWNGAHGRVLVEKRQGTEASPWLVDPDVAGSDGRTYTLRNPALMAREMADLTVGDGPFRLRVTSLRPLNPRNAPDAFEAEALVALDAGAPAVARREERGGTHWLRYVAPLRVEASCLACHERQGYRAGDVRGGVSVAFPVDDAERSKERGRALLLGALITVIAASAGVAWWLLMGLQRQVEAAEGRIGEMAITDDLTGLRNRRHAMQRLDEEWGRARRGGRPVSVALFDVDHLRVVNDLHGQAAGDSVLQAVAAMALRACRASDLVARYGGEEFLVVLPETPTDGAFTIADRLRLWICAMRVDHDARAIRVTASFGVATFDPTSPGPSDPQALVKQAEAALGRAKAEGRNRVSSAA